MTDLMIQLRRSPRTLLERDGHPGPGAGRLALVMGRAGIGKTAFIVGIGIDALLSGQKILHVSLERSVDKIRTWYDDLLMELLRREKKLEHWAAIQLEIERNRHIQTYLGGTFSIDRLKTGLKLMRDYMEFVPQVLILDRLEFEKLSLEDLEKLKAIGAEIGAEIWMSCRTHRDAPQPEAGHLPQPANRVEKGIDLAFDLVPQDGKVRLHVLKDDQKWVNEELNILLNPKTLLLRTGVKR